MSGIGISWAICKYAPQSRQLTMPASHHSVFLQAGCLSAPATELSSAPTMHKNAVEVQAASQMSMNGKTVHSPSWSVRELINTIDVMLGWRMVRFYVNGRCPFHALLLHVVNVVVFSQRHICGGTKEFVAVHKHALLKPLTWRLFRRA